MQMDQTSLFFVQRDKKQTINKTCVTLEKTIEIIINNRKYAFDIRTVILTILKTH